MPCVLGNFVASDSRPSGTACHTLYMVSPAAPRLSHLTSMGSFSLSVGVFSRRLSISWSFDVLSELFQKNLYTMLIISWASLKTSSAAYEVHRFNLYFERQEYKTSGILKNVRETKYFLKPDDKIELIHTSNL